MDTLDTEQVVNLQRKEVNGEYIYFDSQGNYFDQRGLLLDKAKFESLFVKVQQIKTINTEKEKRTKKKLLNSLHKKMSLSEQFINETKMYTQKVLEIVLETYDGKVIGSEDVNIEVLMKELFDEKPSKNVKKGKKDVEKPKKKRALSGYGYFGQQNKDKFNEEISKLDEKVKYITYQSQKWKELSDEEKEEWNVKAKAVKEENETSE
tara:strand:- start:33 stop:653 length:621 start_codon:yes stop_codon:yes gene_type:complete